MELSGWSSPQMLARSAAVHVAPEHAVIMTRSWEAEAPMARNINARIAAEFSWARTPDRAYMPTCSNSPSDRQPHARLDN
jgi:hypothetical protein